MSYADTLLASGETTKRVAHQHWFVLVWQARWAILAVIIALLAGGFAALNASTGPLWTVLSWAVFALLVIGVASFLWGLLRFRSQEFVITSRRIIHAEGVINKRATDSSLEKINDAVLTESLFGRIFGFGDLEVLTASESGIEHLNMLRDAKDFKKAMLEAKHELEIEISRPTMPAVRSVDPAPAPALEASAMPAMAAAAPVAVAAAPSAFAPPPPMPLDDAPTAPVPATDDVAAALSRLADLRDKGLITPEEYDAKRAEQLSRL